MRFPLVLINGATATWPAYRGRIEVGQLTSPSRWGGVWADRWAVDNDAFSKAGFDPTEFFGLLARLRDTAGCLFVACPDVVFDPTATLARFAEWAPRIVDLGFPVAFVTQDGQSDESIPWHRIAALFVGGSDDWKAAPETEAHVATARRRGLWTHMGRVNTRGRLRHAWEIGCDSIDGTGWSKFARDYIRRGERWFGEMRQQPLLWSRSDGPS